MKRTLLIVALCVLAALTVTVLIPGVRRCRAVASLLDPPCARDRASIVLRVEHFDAPPSAHPIDIGYATFDLDTAAPVTCSATGTNATAILVNAGHLKLLILPPFSPESLSPTVTPLTSAMQNLRADPIAGMQEVERTRPLSLFRVFWMNNDAFLSYSLFLSSKARLRLGHNEVLCFTSPHAKGIIQIGMGPTDRRHASLDLSSPDGKICVGFHADLEASSTDDIGPTLERIAGSFQFTISSVPTTPEIARQISDRGIPRRPATQSVSLHGEVRRQGTK